MRQDKATKARMLWGWAGAALLLGASLAARTDWEALLASLGPAAKPKAAP